MESLAWRAPRPCQYTVAVPAPPFFFLFFFFGGRVSVLCRMVHLPRCSAHIFFYFFPLFIREGCVSVPFHLCPRWPSQDQSPFPWTPPPSRPFRKDPLDGPAPACIACMLPFPLLILSSSTPTPVDATLQTLIRILGKCMVLLTPGHPVWPCTALMICLNNKPSDTHALYSRVEARDVLLGHAMYFGELTSDVLRHYPEVHVD